ncbi:MAG: hypothetical protein WC220_00010 [Pedobacter sp.]|jgi:hypothetical protein
MTREFFPRLPEGEQVSGNHRFNLTQYPGNIFLLETTGHHEDPFTGKRTSNMCGEDIASGLSFICNLDLEIRSVIALSMPGEQVESIVVIAQRPIIQE